MGQKTARLWFGAAALLGFVGIVVAVVNAANNSAGHFHPAALRSLNAFAFFTIDSNVLAFLTALLLASSFRRAGTAFSWLLLTSVVCIAVTGVVYNVALRSIFDITSSWDRLSNELIHAVVPAMVVIGWPMAGPRGLLSRKVVWLSLIFPACWLVFTLIRGAIVHWYPYPFIDVTTLGYAKTLINCLWVAVLLLGLAGVALVVDRRLAAASRGEA